MNVPPTVYAAWERQHADAQAQQRRLELARERTIADRIWLERALRSLDAQRGAP